MINEEKLRDALRDYYGTAAFNGFPAAMIDVIDVDNASLNELINFARRAGFDLRDYEEDMER